MIDAPGSYSAVSVHDENVLAAAECALTSQEAVMNEQSALPPVSLNLVQLQRARQQVVAGMNYKMRLKVKVDDTVKQAEAIVWYQAWRTPEPYQLMSWTWE